MHTSGPVSGQIKYIWCLGGRLSQMNLDMEIDSTGESDTSVGGVQAIDRQGIIEHYATLMLQKLVRGPFSSIPEIITTLQYAGPFGSKQGIYEVFGGRRNLKRAITRMNAVRRAALQGTLGDLPMSTRPYIGEDGGDAAPETDEFIDNWAPRNGGMDYSFMGGVMFDDQEAELARYPHLGEDADDFMEDTLSETEEDKAATIAHP